MRLIAIADDDSLVGKLQPPGTVDVLLSLGDLWDTTIARAQQLYQPARTFAVRGNHDSAAPFAASVTPLHLAVASHGALTFGGFSGSWKYKPRGHFLFEQEDVHAQLRHFPRVDMFAAHNSPAGHHERDKDVHQGFDAFRDYIARTQPQFFIHGHQHLNQVSHIGETTVIGVFGETILDISPSNKSHP